MSQSGSALIDGPKALTESYTRLATAADTVLVGALTAAGLDVASAEAVAEQASPSVVYAAQQAASGSVEAAEEGAALGLTDAGGREQYGQTQGAITEALRLALLAEGYDALAADTLSHAAGMEASVGLAQVVGGAVGDSKDGEAPGGGGITYGRRYYVSDHLGSVRAVVTTSGQVVEARDYYAYGLMMPGRTFVQGQETREGYTGHELDQETGMYYAGARYYMPALGRWTSIDNFAHGYPDLSPYNYGANNPMFYIDPSGDTLRVYVESTNLAQGQQGHTFFSVGEGDDMVVFSYGRYAGTDSRRAGKSRLGDGDGVLYRYEGAEAQAFIDSRLENAGEVDVFLILDADESRAFAFAQEQWDSGVPSTQGVSAGDPNARVVDRYNLFGNNCTTHTIRGVNSSGSSVMNITIRDPQASFAGEYTVQRTIVVPGTLGTHLRARSRSSDNVIHRPLR